MRETRDGSKERPGSSGCLWKKALVKHHDGLLAITATKEEFIVTSEEAHARYMTTTRRMAHRRGSGRIE